MNRVSIRLLFILCFPVFLQGCDYFKAIAEIFLTKDPSNITNGIDFKQTDLPLFIESLSGFSFPQQFGRWTEGDKAVITFKDPLPSDVTFRFYIHEAFGPNMKKFSRIVVGHEEKIIKPSGVDLIYTLAVKNLRDVRTIEIIPAQPARPSDLQPPPGQPPSGDGRWLGIMFSRITIQKGAVDY